MEFFEMEESLMKPSVDKMKELYYESRKPHDAALPETEISKFKQVFDFADSNKDG